MFGRLTGGSQQIQPSFAGKLKEFQEDTARYKDSVKFQVVKQDGKDVKQMVWESHMYDKNGDIVGVLRKTSQDGNLVSQSLITENYGYHDHDGDGKIDGIHESGPVSRCVLNQARTSDFCKELIERGDEQREQGVEQREQEALYLARFRDLWKEEIIERGVEQREQGGDLQKWTQRKNAILDRAETNLDLQN